MRALRPAAFTSCSCLPDVRADRRWPRGAARVPGEQRRELPARLPAGPHAEQSAELRLRHRHDTTPARRGRSGAPPPRAQTAAELLGAACGIAGGASSAGKLPSHGAGLRGKLRLRNKPSRLGPVTARLRPTTLGRGGKAASSRLASPHPCRPARAHVAAPVT